MERIYLAMLHYIGFTHKKLHEIFKDNGNYIEVFDNIEYKQLKKYNFNDKQIEIILERYKNVSFNHIKKKLEEREVKIITIHDKQYPNNLKNIFNPPYLFYLRWNIDNSLKFSVIWTRKISSYWNKVIEELIPDISKYFTVVSGGAAWCDTKAHSETIKNNWKTISVIWTWIDLDYPVWNKKLFDEISKTWAVISIFSIWEVGNSYNFPVRNEIVAWLSEGILVVEAKEKSGSLITAKIALDLWKDLFSIAWDIFKWWSIWTNNLIKSWEAKTTTCSNDILEEYNITNKNKENKQKINFTDELEEKIYNILLLENLNIDEIAKKTWEKINNISLKISIMEINFIIKKTNLWKYEII